MIQIPRALVRQFRAVLRKSVLANGLRNLPVWVVIQADDQALSLRAQNTEVAIQLSQAGSRPGKTLVLPAAALTDFEGRDEGLVTLEAKNSECVSATWQDGVVPQVRTYDSVKRKELPRFPEAPAEFIAQPGGFLAALQAASATTSRDNIRFALTNLQLRGQLGQVVATDGRQLLQQSGFSFPWKGDLLVPALPVFGCREFGDGPVQLGRTDDHAVIAAGPWQIFLRIDKDSKFPPTDDVLPDPTSVVARLHLSDEDAEFLVQTLPRLPGLDAEGAPVTLDCNGRFVVRAKAEGQPQATEAVLSGSQVVGQALRCVSDRNYLLRAIKLVLREFHFYSPDMPVLAVGAQRRYLWQVQNNQGILPPEPNALRIASAGTGEEIDPIPAIPERSDASMSKPASSTNGTGHESVDARNVNGIHGLIAEAEALREALRAALARANDLVSAVKRQKKQAQVVQSTLAALRGLQEVEA